MLTGGRYRADRVAKKGYQTLLKLNYTFSEEKKKMYMTRNFTK